MNELSTGPPAFAAILVLVAIGPEHFGIDLTDDGGSRF
jgi:hypothetical protein